MSKTICSVDGCESVSMARGWCRKHYNYWYYHQSTDFLLVGHGTCVVCGVVTSRKAAGPIPKYCSAECRHSFYKENKNAAYSERYKRKRREENAARLAAMVKVCPICGTKFTPDCSSLQMYCSGYCQRKASRDNSSTLCSVEGCNRSIRARGWCSMHYHRWRRESGLENDENWNDRRRAAHHEREALKRGSDCESFSPREVFERDGWMCGICGDLVDPDLKWPDTASASLDHIVPLSKGGPHSRGNTRCSHLHCNTSRGNAYDGGIVEEQLSLLVA